MICPNLECPDHVRFGRIPEFRADIIRCPYCSTALVEGSSLYEPPEGTALRLAENPAFVTGLFRRAPLIEAREAGWIFDTYRWFLTHFGGEAHVERTTLVEPTEEFFPTPRPNEDLAEKLFDRCRSLSGMEDWPCRLVAIEPAVTEDVSAELGLIPESPEPSGMFMVDGSGERDVTISFDVRAVSRPIELVAIFAHELAHYRMVTATSPPPGGEEFEEFATDLASIFMGFGIFTCNAAWTFEKRSDAGYGVWRGGRSSYVPEDSLAFAFALFLRVHEIEPSKALRHLDRNPTGYLEKSLRQLSSVEEEIVSLRSLLGLEGMASRTDAIAPARDD